MSKSKKKTPAKKKEKNKTTKSPKHLKGESLKSKKSPLKDIEKDLKKIYQDDKGKMPKMTSLEFKNKNRALRIVFFIIIVLIIIFAVSFSGFLVFQPQPKFSGDNINLEIKAPFTAISSDNISYKIKYANLEDVSLNNVSLIVYLPNGFIYEKANTEPEAINEEEQIG